MKKVFEKLKKLNFNSINGRGGVVMDGHGGMDASASLIFYKASFNSKSSSFDRDQDLKRKCQESTLRLQPEVCELWLSSPC